MPAALSHQVQASPRIPIPDMVRAYGTHCSTPVVSKTSGGGAGGRIQGVSSSTKDVCVVWRSEVDDRTDGFGFGLPGSGALVLAPGAPVTVIRHCAIAGAVSVRKATTPIMAAMEVRPVNTTSAPTFGQTSPA